MRRTYWSFALAATLLALLAVLGTLQYRWLGDVSNAERDRLRASMRSRAADFSAEFDREITRIFGSFHVNTDDFDRFGASRLSDAYVEAQTGGPLGGLIRGVWLLDAPPSRAPQVHALDPIARTLTPSDWPPELERWRQRATGQGPAVPGLPPPLLIADAIDAETPAVIVPLPAVKRVQTGGTGTSGRSVGDVALLPDPSGVSRLIVVWLDHDRLRQFVQLVAERQFGTPETSQYAVKIVSRDDATRVIYSSAGDADVTSRTADVTLGLFDLRFDEFTRSTFNLHVPPGTIEKSRVAITIVRRGAGAEGARLLMTGAENQGAWQVLVRGRNGSLEAIVARSRRRNLAIGLGVLALLAASVVFVIGSAQRQRRLARQQMEFVAAVSHELRTPLAVIRSAGENLADGVVGDAEQVKRYGSLIRTEGRRLSDMVERVMEFAGISSGAAVRPRTEVDLAHLIADVIGAVQADARDRGVVIASNVEGDIRVVGDEDALRSAVLNIVGNAIKYSPGGGRVDVVVQRQESRVRIVVSDRGLGIDDGDLPHVFKPFYRGRRAIDAQIRGTGVGLSVVRSVVEAHGGDVAIAHRSGGGSVVTLQLASAPGGEALRAEARAAT